MLASKFRHEPVFGGALQMELICLGRYRTCSRHNSSQALIEITGIFLVTAFLPLSPPLARPRRDTNWEVLCQADTDVRFDVIVEHLDTLVPRRFPCQLLIASMSLQGRFIND